MSKNDTLTEKDRAFINGMFAAVADRGEDYVYPDEERTALIAPNQAGACQYTVDRDGERVGSCIIGLAIQKTTGDPHEGQNRDAGFVLRHLKLTENADIQTAAIEAQESQDFGSDWGTSLDRFLNYLNLMGYDTDALRAEYEVSK